MTEVKGNTNWIYDIIKTILKIKMTVTYLAQYTSGAHTVAASC